MKEFQRNLNITPGYFTGNSLFVQAYLEYYNEPPPWGLQPGTMEEALENQKRFGPMKNPELWLGLTVEGPNTGGV